MKTIKIDNTEITKGRPESYLTAAAAAAASTLTSQSIVGFAVNNLIAIGDVGDETTEIVKTHASTAPTGPTITLTAGIVYAHPVYTKIRQIPYDQVEISHSTTVGGTKTVITTTALTLDAPETIYDDSTYSDGYYYTRFKNSISGAFSDYSDPLPYSGYGRDMVAFAINYALKRNKMDGFTKYVDYAFCIDEVNNCLQDMTEELKMWTALTKLNYIAGQTARGVQAIALPDDIWENKGIKSILGIRIGTGEDLTPKKITEFESEMEGVAHTKVTSAAAVGDTTLYIDNSYDFPDSGTVNVYVSNTLIEITYTGVTRSSTAGALTGIPASGDGSITAIIAAATDVWYGEEEGEPDCFTVDSDGNLLIWPLPSATYKNKNVFMDYATGPTAVDSDYDYLSGFRFMAVQYWLTWVIRSQEKNNGKRSFEDGDYIMYRKILSDYKRNEVGTHRKPRQPKINSITY